MESVLLKNMRQCILAAVCAIVFLSFGFAGISTYKTHNSLKREYIQLQESIKKGDAIKNPETALAYFKSITKRNIPEIELRILACKWEIALNRLYHIRKPGNNMDLKETIPGLFKDLNDMIKQCDLLLSKADKINNKITWRVYNIKACVSLVSAFLVLEHEKNDKKAAGMLKKAVYDFKQAIAKADESEIEPETGAVNKNIPRWNLELLCREQEVKKLAFTRIDSERRLKIKQNLEAVIPNRGGYAPGEPVSTIIKK